MTLLSAIAAALIAASPTLEPEPGAAPPAASDAPRTPDLPQTRDPPPLPPEATRAWVPAPREFQVMAGYHVLSLMGLEAEGPSLRLARSLRARTLTLLAADLFAGRTSAGLSLRSASLGVEIWTDPASAVRAGVGLDLGILGYQRATTGEWETLLTPGVRGGLEVAVIRIGSGALLVGGHVAARLGPWSSFALSVGYRGHPDDQGAW